MLQRVETSSNGAVFWVAMVRVCPAVLCCNSLRNTMARVYSSADLWGCWSTYSRAYFSPPIAIVSCCQQMFCNSSCILLLGIEQKQTLKSSKHGNGISFLSSKKLFFRVFSLPFTPDLKLWFWPCSSRQVGSSLPTLTTPAHPHFICWKMRAVSTKMRFRQSTGTHQKFLPSQIFPSISFMSAFIIVYHIPNQIRLKTHFFSLLCLREY